MVMIDDLVNHTRSLSHTDWQTTSTNRGISRYNNMVLHPL